MPISDTQAAAKYGSRDIEGKFIRFGVIGASDLPAICNCDPFMTRLELWHRVMGNLKPSLPTESMKHGLEWEPMLLREFERRFRVRLRKNVEREAVFNDDGPRYIVHADGLRGSGRRKTGYVVEAKTTGIMFRAEPGWGEDETDTPVRVRIQCHGLMFACNLNHCYVPAFVHGIGIGVWRVDWDGELWSAVYGALVEFRQACLADNPPAGDIRLEIARRIRRVPNEIRKVDPELMRTYKEAKDHADLWEKREEDLLNRIMGAAPHAEVYDGGDYGVITYFANNVRSLDRKKLNTLYPEIAEECTAVKPVPKVLWRRSYD